MNKAKHIELIIKECDRGLAAFSMRQEEWKDLVSWVKRQLEKLA